MCDPFFWIGNTLRSFCFRLSHRSPLGLCLKCNHFGNVPSIRVSLARLAAQRCSTRSLFGWWFQAGLPASRAHRAEGNEAGSRRKPQPLRFKPVTNGDLIREGKLLEVHCCNCRPERHLYIDAGSLDLPKRDAGAGGVQPSRLQHLWRQEQRHLSFRSGPGRMPE